MEQTVRVHLAAGGVVLALGIGVSVITSTMVASRAYERRGQLAQNAVREIFVKGSARKRIRSDQADWTVVVKGDGATLAEAYGNMESGEAKVRAALAAAGFEKNEIEAGPVSTETQYQRDTEGRVTNKIERYELSRSVRISTPSVDRVAGAAGEITKLLKDNVQVVSWSPRYTYTKLGDLRVALSGDAAQDARTRADELASRSGCEITTVRSVQSGPIQVTEPNSTDATSGGTYDTSTIDKDVWMSVSATFGVQGR